MSIGSKDNPVEVLAYAIGIALVIAAVLWGFAQIVVAFGTAGAIIIGMYSAGDALGGVVEVWAVRTAAVALGAGGATIAFSVVVNITERVKNDTYAWTLPVIAVFVGLLVEIDKEFYKAEPLVKHFLSAVFAFVMLVGGYLITKQGKVVRTCAILLMLLPPSIILLGIINSSEADDLIQAFQQVSGLQWITIVGIVLLAFFVAALGTFISEKS